MKFHVLATDYDGTLAHDGVVSDTTLASLEKLIKSGRKALMVTGRELDDLFTTFNRPELFEWIVAENGAVLYNTTTREHKILAEPPPANFVEELKRRGVGPISVGQVIVATWQPHEETVLQTIRDLSLELQVIFNKGAVMILPAGVNKAFGLKAALAEMKLSPHNVIGVGDAENDHAFLRLCECGVAVENALGGLKDQVNYITKARDGAGVTELIDILLQDEKPLLDASQAKNQFPIGKKDDGSEVMFTPYQGNILIAGSSGGGKSTFATTVIEGLIKKDYQYCMIDPEGDYSEIEKTTILGDAKRPPQPEESIDILEKTSGNVVANLIGVPLSDRPQEFLKLLSRLQDLRAHFGRPHWLIIDEAHHVLPAASKQASLVLPQLPTRTIFITMHPADVLTSAMQPIDTVVGVGEHGPAVLREWAKIIGVPAPSIPSGELEPGVVLVWRHALGEAPFKMKVNPNHFQRRRHKKKYAEGELPADRSFHFKGSDGKLNIRARNLIAFLQIAEGIGEENWLFHLARHDYSAWIGGGGIKDKDLGQKISDVESQEGISAEESYKKIKELIEKEYTLPTKSLATEKEGAG